MEEERLLSPSEEALLASAIDELDTPTTDESNLNWVDNAVNSNEHHITPNSNTLLVNETTARFSSAVWYQEIQKKKILCGGMGGIMSWVALLLARMQPSRIIMFDDDIVEEVNLAGQFYGREYIGKYKVDAMAAIIRKFSSYASVIAVRDRITRDTEGYDIMISGFDNMRARRNFFDIWRKRVDRTADKSKLLLIDGRLSAECFQILCITGDDEYNIKRYNDEFLFDDDSAIQEVCSYKQTAFCANMIASYMVNLFVNFCANQTDIVYPRDLPFYTEYSADTMYFKTEN